MKTKVFSVPADMMPEVATIIEENDLDNTVKGTDEDDQILLEISYEPEERLAVIEILELLDPENDD